MANDFKRMWTKEELKSNSVLDLPDIPEVVDANSPDIIRVQGKLYYKDVTGSVSNLTNTTWELNETLEPSTNTIDFNLNFTTPLGELSTRDWSQGGIYITTNSFEKIRFDGESNALCFYHLEKRFQIIYYNNWTGGNNAKRITITGGDVENTQLITLLQANAKLVTTIYTYVELGADEELVKSIPTDVSIIEDQGKLELMLEHDGNVLAINDTPNQFLQRRLDKPSAEWNSETSPTDLKTWLEEKLPSMYVGQIINIEEYSGDLENMFFMISYVDNNQVSLKPLSLYRDDQGTSFINYCRLVLDTSRFYIHILGGGDNVYYSFNDIALLKLF